MAKHSQNDGHGSARGRPRDLGVDQEILGAALALMREKGPSAVNVASVSARSGVARTTIYRRFSNREDLLSSALAQVTDQGVPPGAMTVTEKLDWLLRRTEEVLSSGIGMGGIAAVLADSDPEFSAALRRSLDRGLRPVLEQVADDMERGVLAGDDAEALLDLVIGAHLAQTLRHGPEPGPRWRARALAVLSGLLVPSYDEAPGAGRTDAEV